MTVSDFKAQIKQMHSNLSKEYPFDADHVFREGNEKNREIIGSMLDNLMMPGSEIRNSENLKELFNHSKEGKACLLLVEHYSNFDYPAFYRLIEKDPNLGPEVASTLLPIQGMKLSEGSKTTSAFTRSYDTIIIYPSRSIDSVKDPQEKKRVQEISIPINHAAIKELTHRKHHGRMILVFPAGTRYRPWAPDSKKGVREIYSYLKTFDFVTFISINGNILRPNKSEDMALDEPTQDVLFFTVSEPMQSRKIRKIWQDEAPADSDARQYVVDQVMNTLFKMHHNNIDLYESRLKEGK